MSMEELWWGEVREGEGRVGGKGKGGWEGRRKKGMEGGREEREGG